VGVFNTWLLILTNSSGLCCSNGTGACVNSNFSGQVKRIYGCQKHLHVIYALQVKLLLKELEEARGTVVKMTTDHDVSSDVISSSSLLISERLVTFRYKIFVWCVYL
jgi:hypothetical protein